MSRAFSAIAEQVDLIGHGIQLPNYSTTGRQDFLPPRPRATRAHRQAIVELGLRFQPSNSTDLEAYRLRLELLASDCSHISPTLLRAACDRVALQAKGLPYASEILACAKLIIEERDRAATPDAQFHQSRSTQRREAYAARNRDAAANGELGRITADRQFFRMDDPWELRGCRSDGTVIEPRFDDVARSWVVSETDIAVLEQQYLTHDRVWRVCGNAIGRRVEGQIDG
jgi:hypothetical protein